MILLDTHVLVWLDSGSPKLGAKSRRHLDRALDNDALSVAAISFWEVGTLQRKGRLSLSKELGTWRRELLEAGIVEISMSGTIAVGAAMLEAFHADPADRVLVATALQEGLTLYTADRRILEWPGPLQTRDAGE